MGHLLGYARVSTTDQHPQLQVDALQRAGCYRVFTETASGAAADRPTLTQVLDQLRPGDTLVVWKLDRCLESSGLLATRQVEIVDEPHLPVQGAIPCKARTGLVLAGRVLRVPVAPASNGASRRGRDAAGERTRPRTRPRTLANEMAICHCARAS